MVVGFSSLSNGPAYFWKCLIIIALQIWRVTRLHRFISQNKRGFGNETSQLEEWKFTAEGRLWESSSHTHVSARFVYHYYSKSYFMTSTESFLSKTQIVASAASSTTSMQQPGTLCLTGSTNMCGDVVRKQIEWERIRI